MAGVALWYVWLGGSRMCVAGVAVGRVWLGWQPDVCGWGGSRMCVAGVAVRRVWLGVAVGRV